MAGLGTVQKTFYRVVFVFADSCRSMPHYLDARVVGRNTAAPIIQWRSETRGMMDKPCALT
jgi:hypothetical protein